MPDNDYATKQDLRELRSHVDERFDQIIEATRDMQTEALRAFHNWASPADIKILPHEEHIALLEVRLGEIEGRLAKH